MKKFLNAAEFEEHRYRICDIKNFINDGFKKVCDVESVPGQWRYRNIQEDLMFDNHRSWVYLIVLDNLVVKVGETGLTLGIKAWYGNQVTTLTGSKSRLGRLMNGDNTDSYIRSRLREDIKTGHQVSIWAKRCPVQTSTITVAGKEVSVSHTIHKSVEQAILGYFLAEINQLPILNKAKI
jgi:hypothetical protein